MTPRVRAVVKRRIRAAPTKPIAAVARESGVSRQLMSKLVKESSWKSLRRTKVPLTSAEGRERRAMRDTGLVNALKSLRARTSIFFSDEKNFVVDPAYNP